eukprot:TRINITY_DN2550_c0_g1_i1.p1 TRINITY_DN2550_c0_g1~~TRINITY_DN2550_c0_g1_i1.p1  ORF type:complete len:363 (-),score=105.22 TRINITY_DN2550_c0_g1_i1:93-1139(-)
MTAAVFTHYDSPENNVQIQTDYPTPKTLEAGQVLVKVKAAAINPVDWKIMKGNMAMLLSSTFPKGIGFDFAGTVVAVGSGCNRMKAGDDVYGMGHFSETGTCAEYYRTWEKYLSIKPANIGFKQAAAIPLVALTSWQALYSQATVAEGNRVLVLGASGGTGLAAVQIAKAANARVVGVCSGKNAELVTSHGADEVIDYTQQNWWDVLRGQEFDIVYDTVGGYETWTNSWHVLKKNGHFVTICGDSQEKPMSVGEIVGTVSRVAGRKFWSMFSTPNYYNFATSTNFQDLDKISALVADNKFKLPLDSEYSLNQTADALLRNKTSRAVGKVIVVVDASEGAVENVDEKKQ